MKPTRKYHSVTAYHREPGGLRRLDYFVDRIEKRFGNRPEDRKPVRILDVGCGKGNIALPLSSLGYRVTGVDYDAESIGEARQRAAELELMAVFHEGSLDRVEGQKFDVIIASEVLEHQKDTFAFLNSLSGHLAQDGMLLLSVPNGTSLEESLRKFTTHTRIGQAIKRVLKKRFGHQDVQSAASHPHEQFFSWKELRTALAAGGWKVRDRAAAAAVFKEFFYLLGRFFMKRGSPAFHALDAGDSKFAPFFPVSMMDGWLIEAVAQDPSRPLVMQVVTTLSAGGAERLVHDLASHLPNFGFDTLTVSIFGGGPLEKDFALSGARLEVLERRGFLAGGTLVKLKDLMEREMPTVVHTHLFGADVLGRVAAKSARVPVIVSTEHNVNLDHGAIKRAIKSLLSRITTSFVAVSDEAAKYMAAREHVQSGKIRIIRNGIDMTKVMSRNPTPFHDIPRLLVVGRLMPQKDHATLFKALALVKRPWSLQVVGTGDLEDSLKALAERLGIASRVSWLGYRTDVAELLAQSDLFCFSSRWEGLGLAFLEAAAAGVPVVASDLPVLHEVLGDEDAVFAPPGDVPAWAHALTSVLDDPSEAVQKAARAAVGIRSRFSIDRMVAAYAGMYHELIQAKGKKL